MSSLNTTAEIIEDIRAGKMVILMDDEDRENEGDLVIAAECVSADTINFMATQARGLICLTLTEQRCQQLELPLMVRGENGAQFHTNFTMSIEAAQGVTTGISAADRAHTIRTAVARDAQSSDIVQPGHIFPIQARRGGVLTRAGHTEAGCDLARLAGFEPAATIVEIMNEDGSMARRSDLEKFAEQHQLKIGTIADLIHYRVVNEKTIELIKQGSVQTDYGEFNLRTYRDTLYGNVHLVLSRGDINAEQPCLARVHITNTLRDVLNIQNPNDPDGWSISRAMQFIAEQGSGVIVLINSQENSEDFLYSTDVVLGETSVRPSSEGSQNVNLMVGLGSQLLRDVGVGKIRFLGRSIKYPALSGFDLEVVEFIPHYSHDVIDR